jgi:hypothetical protein
MQVKRISRSKIIKTGFLILLFLLPSFAKSFHVSYEEITASATHGHSAHHDADDCPLCLFHYASFTEVDFPAFHFTPLYSSFQPFFCDEKEYQSTLFSYFLRGPPLSITN